jgi:hypothetical protein
VFRPRVEKFPDPIQLFPAFHCGAKFEWRLADDQPFAIIYRLKGFSRTSICISESSPARADVEYLFVQSLPGSGLLFTNSINNKVKSYKDPNIIARQIADKHLSFVFGGTH